MHSTIKSLPAFLLLAGAMAAGAVVATDAADQHSLFVGYDPSPAYPQGRMNPAAPPETKQFDFMVGEFDCVDEIKQGDGAWKTEKAIWNGAYFLNGMGIQDQYWSETFATSNLRIFDKKNSKWMVTFFKMPGYSSGVWSGVKEGDNMVMRKERPTADGKGTALSRLTFYEISPDGYKWVAENVQDATVNASWKSVCKRRR
jgi:hypothetical protein